VASLFFHSIILPPFTRNIKTLRGFATLDAIHVQEK